MPVIETKGAASSQGFGEFAKVGGPPVYIEDVMSVFLYTGTGATQTITNEIDLSTKGGLVWMKRRSTAANHQLYDTARGATKKLASNETTAEATETLGLTAFNSTGFTLGSDSNANGNGSTYASWTFRKQPKFFDVVTYTGDGSGSGKVINHSLGSVPGCIIAKRTDSTGDWYVLHRSVGSSGGSNAYGVLNSTAAWVNPGLAWGGFAPTATQFSVESNLNTNGATYVAYLFAHDAGGFGATGTDNVISCGSFTADGSGNATVNLGYEPQFIIQKLSSGTGNWETYDIMRGWSQTQIAQLYPNLSSAEGGGTATFFFPTATGFQWVGGALTAGGTYIYIAIRRGPMKTPTSGTSVFYPQAVAQTGTPDSTNVPFAPDLVTTFSRNGTDRASNFDQFQIADRLRSLGIPDNSYSSSKEGRSLVTSSQSSEYSANIPNGQTYIQLKADGINITRGGGWASSSYGDWIYYFFRRAPGFFDVVCYTGTGSARTVTHNLGVAPELLIVKSRTGAGTYWMVQSAALGATKFLHLESTDAEIVSSNPWNNTAPTSTVFTVGNDSDTNGSGANFVSYLFATCPGVSKVTNFTGTGSLQTINCGFTSGARWVLVKRTDAAGDWYVWDSARGISSSNDPYLLLNSTAAEVTTTNWVDTTSTGFQVTAAAGNNVNINGASYIALAIA